MSKLYSYRKTTENKDKYVRARVTEDEQGLIKNHALLKGMTVSEYILHLINKDMNGEQGKL